jgi:hypothetical protein
MKFLATLLATLMILFSVSAEAQSRGRYVDQNGMPYGGHNPPVGVGGAHCMYSVYGCTGAGGSTNYYGYRPGYRPYPPIGHYPHPGYGYGGYPCNGNHASRHGNIGYYNGQIYGNFGFSSGSSTSGCNGNLNSTHRHGNIGYYNGQVQGNIGFSQSQSN